MREILFRGKRVDSGEWETGSLVYARMGTSEEQASIADKMTAYHTPVIPETVGQYTGLKDVHGTRIFEGDIVRFVYNTTNLIVAFLEFSWQLKHPNYEYYRHRIEQNDNNRLEVIGNIYDNPELLEGEQ